ARAPPRHLRHAAGGAAQLGADGGDVLLAHRSRGVIRCCPVHRSPTHRGVEPVDGPTVRGGSVGSSTGFGALSSAGPGPSAARTEPSSFCHQVSWAPLPCSACTSAPGTIGLPSGPTTR